MSDIEKRLYELLDGVTNNTGWVRKDFVIGLIKAAMIPPEGFVLMPLEPTQDMVDEVLDEVNAVDHEYGREVRRHYERMIAARPEVK